MKGCWAAVFRASLLVGSPFRRFPPPLGGELSPAIVRKTKFGGTIVLGSARRLVPRRCRQRVLESGGAELGLVAVSCVTRLGEYRLPLHICYGNSYCYFPA